MLTSEVGLTAKVTSHCIGRFIVLICFSDFFYIINTILFIVNHPLGYIIVLLTALP